MCRFIAYQGAPISMSKLLYEPKNSLIHQSYHAQEREEPLNGDGFGVAWYAQEIEPTPATFVSIQPAWNNRNLRNIARKIRSNCIFAHIRAASKGNVSENNCHPFDYKNLLFMHNGDIGGFREIKRTLRMNLADEIYDWIQGETDSEHFFALFLDNLLRNGGEQTSENFVATLKETFVQLKEILKKNGVNKPVLLNVAITNGDFMVATRYVSGAGAKPNTLYHSEGSRYECHNGVCEMVQADSSQHAVLIVSEKLTDIKEDWHEVPVNHFVAVDKNLSVSISPINA